MRRGFTLMEVNLAMFIMAVGTLGLVSLYTFGYRENQQSTEDVQSAAMAEMTLNAIASALSTTNMTWSDWKAICPKNKSIPDNGWGDYVGDSSSLSDNIGLNDISSLEPPTEDDIKRFASQAWGAIPKIAEFPEQSGFNVGIVITPKYDHRVYAIAVRCGKRAATLVYQPLYYTEVCFQGLDPQ